MGTSPFPRDTAQFKINRCKEIIWGPLQKINAISLSPPPPHSPNIHLTLAVQFRFSLDFNWQQEPDCWNLGKGLKVEWSNCHPGNKSPQPRSWFGVQTHCSIKQHTPPFSFQPTPANWPHCSPPINHFGTRGQEAAARHRPRQGRGKACKVKGNHRQFALN